jgi:hypothetical protein
VHAQLYEFGRSDNTLFMTGSSESLRNCGLLVSKHSVSNKAQEQGSLFLKRRVTLHRGWWGSAPRP